mmetsp:Transcript_16899/g.54637  ORF Transcript_16899/g.54637 Transcript_16899/m.54637 type:complete len:206 (+) Transcript_16899:90-707(+)
MSGFQFVGEDQYWDDPLAPCLRTIVLIVALSVWHADVNELSSPSMALTGVRECGLFDDSGRGHTSVALLSILIAWSMVELLEFRMPNLGCLPAVSALHLWSLFAIMLGAHMTMAVKPDTWSLSYRWAGCYENYGHALVGRASFASYTMITSGALEILRDLLRAQREKRPNPAGWPPMLWLCFIIACLLLVLIPYCFVLCRINRDN